MINGVQRAYVDRSKKFHQIPFPETSAFGKQEPHCLQIMTFYGQKPEWAFLSHTSCQLSPEICPLNLLKASPTQASHKFNPGSSPVQAFRWPAKVDNHNTPTHSLTLNSRHATSRLPNRRQQRSSPSMDQSRPPRSCRIAAVTEANPRRVTQILGKLPRSHSLLRPEVV